MRRICLFAGYNYNNIISDYVINYIKELSKHSEVYYLANDYLPELELSKIKPYIKNGWISKHGKYDFISYSKLAKTYVGWDTIDSYDELLMVNDNCMCVNSFTPVFDKMDSKDLDAWWLLFTDSFNIDKTYEVKDYFLYDKNYNSCLGLGSYFISLRSSFFKTFKFKNFLNSFEKLNNKIENYINFERDFYLLMHNETKISCFYEQISSYPISSMTEAFMLIKNSFPLLNIRIFIDNIGGTKNVDKLAAFCEKYCDYPYLSYIKNIRSERNITKRKHENKINNTIKYFTPVFINDFWFFSKKNWGSNKNFKVSLKKFVKYVTPEFLHDLIKFPKTVKNIFNNKQLRFTLKKRPTYSSYYPCHIKNYEKIQINRLKNQLVNYNGNAVIFFNIMQEVISGGMLSIDRLVQHSSKIMSNVTVIQSGLPLNNAIINNPFFEYSIPPIDFKYLIKKICPQKLLLNIPEAFLVDFIDNLDDEDIAWLSAIPCLCINILNQADELMPSTNYIEIARLICANKLTITAAHQRYCTKEKENFYQCPIYLLTPFLPEFDLTTFDKKEKIIIFSPDTNKHKDSVVSHLKEKLPDFKFVTITKMKFEDYKKLISKAMFTITFGEGYDGYFIEPVLSGSISFAVYNDLYFPKNICKLDTLYSSWSELNENIVLDIVKYSNNPDVYNLISTTLRNEVRKFTNDDLSNRNLEDLYRRFMKSKK